MPLSRFAGVWAAARGPVPFWSRQPKAEGRPGADGTCIPRLASPTMSFSRSASPTFVLLCTEELSRDEGRRPTQRPSPAGRGEHKDEFIVAIAVVVFQLRSYSSWPRQLPLVGKFRGEGQHYYYPPPGDKDGSQTQHAHSTGQAPFPGIAPTSQVSIGSEPSTSSK